MTTVTDLLGGLSDSAGFKVPVRAATTANLSALEGLLTVDGITLVADDRVLVKNQTDTTQNGIYVADTSEWERAEDFNGTSEVVNGTLVRVNSGTTLSGTFWAVSGTDPIIPGTTAFTFVNSGVGAASAVSVATTATLAATNVQAALQELDSEIVALAAGLTDYSSQGVTGGRLTLTTAVPVLTTSVTAQTTVYFTPYLNNRIALYNGTAFVQYEFSEISQATTDNTKSPAAVTTNSNYDLFVWNDAGTLRLSRGPLWSSSTARGTGAGTTELTRIKGIYVNANAITNGPAANRGTYVGTVRSNGSSQIDFRFDSSPASGGTAARLFVWNMYNRVPVYASVHDNTDSWTYNATTFRQANNSAGMQVEIVRGLNEDPVSANYGVLGASSTTGPTHPVCGLGLDSVTARIANCILGTGAANASVAITAVTRTASSLLPGLGYHYLAAIERASAANSITFYGDAGDSTFTQNGLVLETRA